MEGEREEQGENAQSEPIPTEGDTLTQKSSEESGEHPKRFLEPEEDDQDEGGTSDGEVDEPGQVGEDLCVSDVEIVPPETPTATDTLDDAGRLSLFPPPTDEEVTHPSVSSHPSNTQNRPSEPCWYCLRSLDIEYHHETPEQEDSDRLSPPPSSDQKVSYQTDPRPHFGVAWSSHSTCRPLWGSEGPCWGQRNQDVPDQTHTCPHCHLGLPPDTLRWHEAKCLLFDDLRNTDK